MGTNKSASRKKTGSVNPSVPVQKKAVRSRKNIVPGDELLYLEDTLRADFIPEHVIHENGKLAVKYKHFLNLNHQARNLAILMDSARSIMAEMDLDSLLRLIMSKVTDVMKADRSTLFLIDKDTSELWSRVAQGTSEIRIPSGAGIVGYTARTGETLNLADAYDDPRFNRELDKKTGYRTRSMISMAVKNPQGEIIGAIQVLNKLDGSVFSETDQALLEAFCSLAGISLANAQAYEELQLERDLLEVRVAERTHDLEESRKKSDELLLNILPSEIAEELKESGRAAARSYEMVSVLFTDFKGFTMKAADISPEELVTELDRFFCYFDDTMDRYHLEKIKTIGDAYMSAGGIPVPNRTNPVDAVLAALEIQRFMKILKESREAAGESFWELRLGIHTGPVTAGVVGKRKFAYDIWGDAVNTASRMESSGEPGKVNISEATYDYIKDFFVCTPRGKIYAKNKGEISMYFVEGIRPELSVNRDGQIPNQAFISMRAALEGGISSHLPGTSQTSVKDGRNIIRSISEAGTRKEEFKDLAAFRREQRKRKYAASAAEPADEDK